MTVLQTGLSCQSKRILHILHSLTQAFVGLALLETDSLHCVADDGQSCHRSHTAGDSLTLVVATLPLSLPCQRNRYDEVDALKKSVSCKFLRCHVPHDLANLGTVVVFQLMDDAAHLRPCLIVEQCCGTLDGYASPETARHRIVCALSGKKSAGKVKVA